MKQPFLGVGGAGSAPNQGMASNQRTNLIILGVFVLGFFLGSQQHNATVNVNDNASISNSQNRQLKGIKFDPRTTLTKSNAVLIRDVHVGTMCRCGSKAFPIPAPMSEMGRDTTIIQPPSKATGLTHSKRFIMHPPAEGSNGCTCIEDHVQAEPTIDSAMMNLHTNCAPVHETEMDYDAMPDFGVEEKLPVFVGVLSYKSPLSLNGTLYNWRQHQLFRRINAQDVYVQLNKRSELDDEVMDKYQQVLEEDGAPPVTVMGGPEENLNPGLAISKFCRAAEAHPNSHPNGENLMMFLEKDWNLYDGYQTAHLEEVFHSLNALAQRGVHYIRLAPQVREVTFDGSKMWHCPSQGVPWACTTAHQHRWTNTPSVVSCKWFLRYLEPFALMSHDPIMYGCRDNFQQNKYCDWEEASMTGRVAWTNSQWVIANLAPPKPRLFFHQEVDQ